MPSPRPSSPAMPCRRLTLAAVLAVALQITGLSLFVLGFFPVKPTLTGFSGGESYVSPEESEERLDVGELEGEEIRGLYRELSRVPASYDRLIFMVIDGLPAEFVLGKDGQLPPAELKDAMPYTQSLLENGVTIGYHAKAAPPTVTMPRLKALMSGAVGGFLDVAFNFNTQALLEDNLLAQFARIGWKMVMLGDDTWLKLFPELFARHDGVSSFFVKDTVFVDRNVSRHLSTELDKDDWRLLILHYLGLDHIGHIGGRKSVLMIPKLGEMDEVIRMIHLNNIANHDDHRGQTLLVVVSDHGMTADGNHGGSSHDETDSLALFIGSSLEAPGYASSTHNFANQVDITPTLALLFGVPIPINNIGVVIEESLDQLTDDQKLRALELNSWQLLRLLQAQLSGLPCLSLPSDCCDDHQKSDACNGMVKEKFCCLYSKATASHRAWRSQNMSRSADRDQYNLTISAYYGFLTSASEWLSHRVTDKPVGQLALGILAMVLSCLMFLSLLYQLCFHWLLERHRDSGMQGTMLCSAEEVFAVIAVLILVLSMGSSSMVEEEQYTWHFMASTFSILLLRRAVKCIPTGREKFLGKVANGRSSSQIFCIFVLLIVARIIRGWHQGGVNWTYLPDISKWLEKAGSSYVKSIQLFSLLLLIGWNLLAFSSSTSRRSFTVLVKLSFFCSGLLVLQHLLKYQDDALAASSYGATLVTQIIYAVLAISTFITVLASPWLASVSISAKGSTCYTNQAASLTREVKTSSISAFIRGNSYMSGWTYIFSWSLLQLLLQKPTNSAPILSLLLQIQVIFIYFKNDGLNRKPWVEVFALYLLGMNGHFGLGNTNTLATIDVAAAFIGISSYSTVLSGILMFSITYASPMLVLISLVMYVSVEDDGSPQMLPDAGSGHILQKMIGIPCLVLLCINSIQLTAYTIVLLQMRNHLFIWSVFSPKYLYVCATTACIYVGITILVVTEVYICIVYSLRRAG
ncbi:hypothetical protein Drorol1_Dr00021917 [Drosera rotundifolia]